MTDRRQLHNRVTNLTKQMITRDRAHQKESIDIVSGANSIMMHRGWPDEVLEAYMPHMGLQSGNFEILYKLSRVELASICHLNDSLTIV